MILSALFLALTPTPAATLPSVCLAADQAPAPTARILALGEGDPLTIVCPPLAKITCGESSDPADLGFPEVSGGCSDPIVTYSDQLISPPRCAADRFDERIIRTWTVTDSCGNSASCTQRIDVVKFVGYLDIKPTSCPNPFNLGGGGGSTVQMSILGTATFDVTTIDPSTVQLWTKDCAAGPVVPSQWSYEDKATPMYTGTGDCACTTQGPDGFLDIGFKFSKAQMQNLLGLANHQGSFVRLYISADLTNGCGFVASDCVRVQ